MNHTPGPWRWTKDYNTSDGRETWSLLGSYGYGILSCDGVANSPQGIGNDENARLIAAAPELLEACKEASADLLIAANDARDAAKTDNRWCGVAEHLTRRRQQVEAAIAKAEGRTQ